jgi:AsmA protein
VAAEASLAGLPLRAMGSTGTPALLAGRAPGPLPLDLRLAAAGAEATIRGQVRDPRALAGVDLALAAQVPDLAALSPLAGAPLPALRDLRAAARLAERGAGFLGGAFLRGVTITSAPAEARGDITWMIGERHGLAGRLDVARLDLDALRAAQPAGPPGDTAPAPAKARDGRVIPDLPLPIGALRTFDAELDLAVAVLTAGGAPWRDIRAPIRVTAGRARIAPLSVTTPGGPLSIEIAADAAAATPTLRVALRAPALDLAPLQRAFGQPVRISGHGEVDADFRGAGAGLRQVAASLGGHLGLAMLDATLEPPLTAPVQATLRARVPVLPDVPQRLPVECVALRAEAEGGTLRIGTLLVDAPAAKVAGSGTVNLGTEALALRVLHDIRAAGSSLRVAADLGGTLAEPAYRRVQAQNLGEVLGGLAGRVGGDAGALLGALANRNGARPEALPDCAPALAAARGGREGALPTPRAARTPEAAPAPQPPSQPDAAPTPPAPGPAGDLLRGLLRR